MEQPPGFEKKKENLVCRLKKSLYGLKQSPRQWYKLLDRFLRELSLKSTQSEIYYQYKARQSETNDFTLKLSTFINSLKFKDIQDTKGIIYTLNIIQ